MRGRKGISILAAALSLSFLAAAGCEDTAKHTVQVRQQAPTPQARTSAAGKIGALPFPEYSPDLQELVVALHPAVDALIEQVQATYDAGQQAYQAGQLDVARKDFNAALDRLMKSGLEATGDQRLQELFNRIVDTMQNYEMEAEQKDEAVADDSQQDDMDNADATDDTQTAAQPESTAPIEEIANMESLPATDPRLAAMAEKELISVGHDLPLTVNASVLQYLSFFESPRGRAIAELGLQRAGRYRAMIESTLKKEGVPQDLIYLAQAESAFKPRVVSSMGARGIWQFMPYTGEEYGLSRNYWVDQRDDPVAATRAAAEHFRDLYQMFGDWYLVMAAYNSGPLNVARAVERTGYADFWELYHRNVLPKETKNYVPIILAVTIMAKNPSQYGLDDVVMEKPAQYDTATIDYPVDLRLVAETVNSTVSDLQDLNPSLLRLTTPREGKFDLHLPIGTKDQYQTAIATIPPDMRLWWRYHTVHQGDTLASLAREYHTTARSISEKNHLDGSELESDAKLIIPVTPGKHPSDTATYARHITRYKVHSGDTVESVAENFGISAQQLRRWNGIRGNSLAGRRVLALHLPISPGAHQAEVASSRSRAKKPAPKGKTETETADAKAPASKSSEVERLNTDKSEIAVVHHKVKSGETLYSIATLYKTTVAALKRDNRNIAVIRPGMILNVPVAR